MSGERPFLIGLTGNIGTGKSTVAGMLVALGAEAIDADKVAHTTMCAGTPVHARIVETFGQEMLAADGEIDRRRLGELVFADRSALGQLEAIVHPATLKAVDRRVAGSSATVVVVEAIKLIESGMAGGCDSIWVTTCRPEQQIERLMRARGWSRADVVLRVRAQAPQEAKLARADVAIDTSGTLDRTREQVRAAWARLVDSVRA